jgi:hypothetical protein
MARSIGAPITKQKIETEQKHTGAALDMFTKLVYPTEPEVPSLTLEEVPDKAAANKLAPSDGGLGLAAVCCDMACPRIALVAPPEPKAVNVLELAAF